MNKPEKIPADVRGGGRSAAAQEQPPDAMSERADRTRSIRGRLLFNARLHRGLHLNAEFIQAVRMSFEAIVGFEDGLRDFPKAALRRYLNILGTTYEAFTALVTELVDLEILSEQKTVAFLKTLGQQKANEND